MTCASHIPAHLRTRSLLLLFHLEVPADQSVQRAATRQPLHADAIGDQPSASLPLVVILPGEAREAVVARNVDLLAPCELEARATQRFCCDVHLFILGADRDEHLSDVHASS